MKKPMNRRPLFHKESIARMTLSAMVAMGSMLGGPQARAVTYTWNTTTGNWSVAGDWLPASVPSSAAGNDLLFSGGSYVSTQDTGAAFNLLSLRFTNSGAVTLAGSATNIIDFIPGGFNPFCWTALWAMSPSLLR